MRMLSPEISAAEKFAGDDHDLEQLLRGALTGTSSVTDGLLQESSLKCTIEVVRKLSKYQVGIYALAAASIEQERPGITEAALLVLRTMDSKKAQTKEMRT